MNERSGSAGEPEQLLPHSIEGVQNATQVAVANHGGCALVGGEVACWGSNRMGLRGLGHDQPVASVVSQVPGLDGVVDLDVGGTFGCAVLSDGRLRCWGALVGGDRKTVVAPVDIAGVSEALDVTCAGYGYCVRTRNGLGSCTPKAGQPATLRWPADVTEIVASVGGTEHGSCAILRNGDVRCSGQLARADIVPLVEAMHRPRSLAIGDGHACALDAESRVVCVGDDSVGQLATGKLLFSTEPVLVP
jgi:alpha-tubulin suppressor-like RCC1 family protein